MKVALYLGIALLSLSSVVTAQIASPTQTGNAETKGLCSPIAPNNTGSITITCSGFSEQQNRQLLSFLRQLSERQSNEQELLLAKLAEILETVRRSTQRIISDEQANSIKASPWASCYPSKVVITAPTGDAEAQGLAVQIKNLLSAVGMNPYAISYKQITLERGKKADLQITSNQVGYCIGRYLGAPLTRSFAIDFERWKNPDPSDTSGALSKGPEWDQKLPVFITVYGK